MAYYRTNQTTYTCVIKIKKKKNVMVEFFDLTFIMLKTKFILFEY